MRKASCSAWVGLRVYVKRSTLDVNLLPHFECSMNIWDDNKYNSCSAEENVDINYVINLSVLFFFRSHTKKKGPTYEQDCAQFISKLKAFLATNQIMSYRPPTLGRKEVDLYRLFREVTAYGGCDSVVSKEGTWAKIYRGLDNFSPTETSASFRLKKMYNKYLLAYEKHVFNFLPIPAKKHRFHVPSTPTPNSQVISAGIQNSIIFPPSTYTYEEAPAKRPTKGFLETSFRPSHRSVRRSNSTHCAPGAGIGLATNVNWSMQQTKRPSNEISEREVGGHYLRDLSPRLSSVEEEG